MQNPRKKNANIREEGKYWVLFIESSDWEIATWKYANDSGYYWSLVGYCKLWNDNELFEIYPERILNPDEQEELIKRKKNEI